MAPASGFKPHHLPDAVVQAVRCGAPVGALVFAQAAVAEVLARAGSLKSHPDVVPRVGLVRLIGSDFPRQDEKSLARADDIAVSLGLIDPAAGQTEVQQVVVPDGGAYRIARGTVLPAAEQERQLSDPSRVLRQPGFFHPAPPLWTRPSSGRSNRYKTSVIFLFCVRYCIMFCKVLPEKRGTFSQDRKSLCKITHKNSGKMGG